ncbi:MAG: biosis protein MshJ [Massilia sp.]|jgi:MSHA biogenesis protein MshJ
MKEQWTRLAARIDALTPRERILMFAACAALVVFLGHFLALGPQLRKQAALQARILQQQNNIEGIDNEIRARVEAAQADPDAPARARLAAVRSDIETLGTQLRAMQNGLVAPERMAPLLDTILRANGRLTLVSVRTLPAESVLDAGRRAGAGTGSTAAPGAAAAAAPAAAVATGTLPPASELLYRHGVEITVRGSYLDMIDYMAALESLPTQLFWGRAQLEAETWPASRLTLTLYTLSLDRKWMKF